MLSKQSRELKLLLVSLATHAMAKMLLGAPICSLASKSRVCSASGLPVETLKRTFLPSSLRRKTEDAHVDGFRQARLLSPRSAMTKGSLLWPGCVRTIGGTTTGVLMRASLILWDRDVRGVARWGGCRAQHSLHKLHRFEDGESHFVISKRVLASIIKCPSVEKLEELLLENTDKLFAANITAGFERMGILRVQKIKSSEQPHVDTKDISLRIITLLSERIKEIGLQDFTSEDAGKIMTGLAKIRVKPDQSLIEMLDSQAEKMWTDFDSEGLSAFLWSHAILLLPLRDSLRANLCKRTRMIMDNFDVVTSGRMLYAFAIFEVKNDKVIDHLLVACMCKRGRERERGAPRGGERERRGGGRRSGRRRRIGVEGRRRGRGRRAYLVCVLASVCFLMRDFERLLCSHVSSGTLLCSHVSSGQPALLSDLASIGFEDSRGRFLRFQSGVSDVYKCHTSLTPHVRFLYRT